LEATPQGNESSFEATWAPGDESLLADFSLSESDQSTSPSTLAKSPVRGGGSPDDKETTLRTSLPSPPPLPRTSPSKKNPSTPAPTPNPTPTPGTSGTPNFQASTAPLASGPFGTPNTTNFASAAVANVPSTPTSIAPPPLAWLFSLRAAERQQLQSCLSPYDAVQVMRDYVGGASNRGCGQSPYSGGRKSGRQLPGKLADDLLKHTQIAQQLALELDEQLKLEAQQQSLELQKMREQHRKACRNAQFQLLAELAPNSEAAIEALACKTALDADESPKARGQDQDQPPEQDRVRFPAPELGNPCRSRSPGGHHSASQGRSLAFGGGRPWSQDFQYREDPRSQSQSRLGYRSRQVDLANRFGQQRARSQSSICSTPYQLAWPSQVHEHERQRRVPLVPSPPRASIPMTATCAGAAWRQSLRAPRGEESSHRHRQHHQLKLQA